MARTLVVSAFLLATLHLHLPNVRSIADTISFYLIHNSNRLYCFFIYRSMLFGALSLICRAHVRFTSVFSLLWPKMFLLLFYIVEHEVAAQTYDFETVPEVREAGWARHR